MPGPTAIIGTEYTNGHVTLAKDLVFGLCVLCEDQYGIGDIKWVPFDDLLEEHKQFVRKAVDHGTIFPKDFIAQIYKP